MKPTLLYMASSDLIITDEDGDSSKLLMPLDIFRFWFNALRDDNNELVSDLLSAASKAERNRLLNGEFEYMDDKLNVTYTVGGKGGLRKPLTVCVCYSSFNVLATLIKYGIILECTDTAGNNILHFLVRRVLLKPHEEIKVLNTFRFVL